MTANHAEPTDTTDAPTAHLPLAAAAAASARPPAGEHVISYRFPPLPSDVTRAVAAAWRVRITHDAAADDPRDGAAFSALLAHARSEQVVRALARHTNLVLPAATVLVVGDGPVADTIGTTLSSGGSRVIRATDDPIARLRAHLRGGRTAASSAPWPIADLLIASGEGHAPLDPLAAHAVAIDGSIDGTGLVATTGETVRPSVERIGPRSWVVEPPSLFAAADGTPGRIADLLVALSIVRTRSHDADTELAELALA